MHFNVYSRYFYSKLDDKSKTVYKKILQNWLELKTTVNLLGSFKDVDFYKVFSALRDDNPELFYVNLNSVSVSTSSLQTIIKVKFYYAIDEIINLKDKINRVVTDFKIKNNKTLDKEKAIHDFLALSVEYSSDLYARNAHNICGPLIDKCSVCEGYAYAFKLLCDEMKIPCMVVHGTAQNSNGKRENHSWNIVKVNNNNFHVDVTWNSDSMKTNGSSLYYNVSESFIRRNHMWDIRQWPRCQVQGELESEIINVKSFEDLCEELKKSIRLLKKQIVFANYCNLSSSQAASELVSKALHKINANIYAFSVAFIDKIDCVSLVVEYSK